MCLFSTDDSFISECYEDRNYNIFEDEREIVEPIAHPLKPVEIPKIVVTPPTPTVVASNNHISNIFDESFSVNSGDDVPELENAKSYQEKQHNEKITLESNSKKCENKNDEKIVITNSTVSIILQNDDQSSATRKLVTNGLESVIKNGANSDTENGVFRYALHSCFANSCKKHYSILRYNGDNEPDFWVLEWKNKFRFAQNLYQMQVTKKC